MSSRKIVAPIKISWCFVLSMIVLAAVLALMLIGYETWLGNHFQVIGRFSALTVWVGVFSSLISVAYGVAPKLFDFHWMLNTSSRPSHQQYFLGEWYLICAILAGWFSAFLLISIINVLMGSFGFPVILTVISFAPWILFSGISSFLIAQWIKSKFNLLLLLLCPLACFGIQVALMFQDGKPLASLGLVNAEGYFNIFESPVTAISRALVFMALVMLVISIAYGLKQGWFWAVLLSLSLCFSMIYGKQMNLIPSGEEPICRTSGATKICIDRAHQSESEWYFQQIERFLTKLPGDLQPKSVKGGILDSPKDGIEIGFPNKNSNLETVSDSDLLQLQALVQLVAQRCQGSELGEIVVRGLMPYFEIDENNVNRKSPYGWQYPYADEVLANDESDMFGYSYQQAVVKMSTMTNNEILSLLRSNTQESKPVCTVQLEDFING